MCSGEIPHESYQVDSFAAQGLRDEHLVLRLTVAVNDCVETEVSISHKLYTWFYEHADPHSRQCTLRVRTKSVSIATLLKR